MTIKMDAIVNMSIQKTTNMKAELLDGNPVEELRKLPSPPDDENELSTQGDCSSVTRERIKEALSLVEMVVAQDVSITANTLLCDFIERARYMQVQLREKITMFEDDSNGRELAVVPAFSPLGDLSDPKISKAKLRSYVVLALLSKSRRSKIGIDIIFSCLDHLGLTITRNGLDLKLRRWLPSELVKDKKKKKKCKGYVSFTDLKNISITENGNLELNSLGASILHRHKITIDDVVSKY